MPLPKTASNPNNIIIEKLNIMVQPLRDRHARHYRDSYFHFWADILLAATLIGLVVTLVWLMIWQPKPDFVLDAELETTQVLSGQSEEFIINYENEEGLPIEAVTLTALLPEHFIFESAQPAAIYDPQTSTFLIGNLEAGDSGQLRLRGRIQGAVDERQTLAMNLTYRHGDIRKQLLNSLTYHIDASVLETRLVDFPDNAYRSVAVNGGVEVTNTGRVQIDNAVLSFPESGWQITPQSGSLQDGNLALAPLAAGESRHISFTAINESPVGDYNFSVETSLLLEDDSLRQSIINESLTLAEPSLAVNATFKDKALSGGSATLDLNFTNNDAQPLSNLVFTIESRRDTMAVGTVTSATVNVTSANNVLQYTKELGSRETGELSALISLTRHSTLFNDFLDLGVTVSYTMAGKEYKYQVAVPKLKINSNLTVSSNAYYYGPQGDQLGIGPLPPKVDIPTTYWVIWEANNLGNDVKNFEVSADLPPNVVWVDQKSVVAGDLSYSPVGRRVLWKIDSLAETGGNYRVSFAISLVPRQIDLGLTPNLLSNLSFSGQDLYTGASIIKKLPNITTNLEADRLSSGKGIVEALE